MSNKSHIQNGVTFDQEWNFTKTFDRVNPDIIFEILSRASAPDKEIYIIKNIYIQQKATLRYENETSEEKRSTRLCIAIASVQNVHGIHEKRASYDGK